WLADLAAAQQEQQQRNRPVPFTVQDLTEYLSPCLRDPASAELRSACRRVFTALLTCGVASQPVCRPALFQSLRTCWCHVDESIQNESVQLLESLLTHAPIVLLERADDFRALLNRSLKRRLTATVPTGASAAAAGAGVASASVAQRSRGQLMSLAACVASFADLLAENYSSASQLSSSDASSSAQYQQSRILDYLPEDFDLNSAAWSRYQLSWNCDLAATDSDPTALVGLAISDLYNSSSNKDKDLLVDDAETGGAESSISSDSSSFEVNFASLIKELFPAEFSGRVGGVNAYEELLALLKCLRSLLALHFARTAAGRRDRGGDNLVGSEERWWQYSGRKRSNQKRFTPCQLAVSDLLSSVLCPLFPLTVSTTADSSSAGSGQANKKRRKNHGGRDALKDLARKSTELNNAIVECALLAGPQLQACLGQANTDAFALAVYNYLAARYSNTRSSTAKILATDTTYWLNASSRLVCQHLDSSPLARLFLAFFADSMRKNRFEQPDIVADFLVNLATYSSSISSVCRQSLDFLPQYLIDRFDAAQLHLLPPVSASSSSSSKLLNSASPEQQSACSAVCCLLLLLASQFPGAEEAAIAACDRLVRYCPDRLLRRSLSASLASVGNAASV
uniref:BLM10_mid domain-containing protein n=1 Tax=Macrostomum lignano TaxID=282301 RepID=A0A1I8IS68_9PLAT